MYVDRDVSVSMPAPLSLAAELIGLDAVPIGLLIRPFRLVVASTTKYIEKTRYKYDGRTTVRLTSSQSFG